jgi:hypothetical protein
MTRLLGRFMVSSSSARTVSMNSTDTAPGQTDESFFIYSMLDTGGDCPFCPVGFGHGGEMSVDFEPQHCAACKTATVAVKGDICGLCRMKLKSSRLDTPRMPTLIYWVLFTIAVGWITYGLLSRR